MKTEYRIVTYYNGWDSSLDRKIESVIGRSCSGSGAGLGGRDIDFVFYQKPATLRALSRINLLPKKVKVKLYINDEIVKIKDFK